MKGHRSFLCAALALGFAAVGCAGSKSAVKPTLSPNSSSGELSPGATAGTPGATGAAAADKPSLAPIYFDFDQAQIHPEDLTNLEGVGTYLQKNPERLVTVSGHCDERGTIEYNIALGDRRAAVARDYLVRLGVDAARIRTISYGEAQPADAGHDESAWAKNRRDEFQLEHKQRANAK